MKTHLLHCFEFCKMENSETYPVKETISDGMYKIDDSMELLDQT